MTEQPQAKRSLARIAGIVAIATLISKLFGLVRQQAIAAAFGVGPAFEAYNYAYVVPGFLLILLGGINGPFHSAMVSVLAKRDQREAAPLVESITTLVSGVLLIVTILVIVFAGPLIELVAPGLGQTPAGLAIRAIAVRQLQLMAPMALFAGLIGIGFGTLNASDQYWLPSISPLFSSLTVIGGLVVLALNLGPDIATPEYAMLGGIVLAVGTLLGAVLQWLVQVVAQWRSGMGSLRLRFDFRHAGVQEVLKIMGPATFASGMMQINVYTDLFFASFIPPAASALGYAGLLVQTPLGILSNMILVPLLPVFSRLTDPQDWPALKERIRQGLILTALSMLPLGALMVVLADPIVRVVYERGAFQSDASKLVAAVLMAYGVGMFVYLGRDVLVRVFYALGDAQTPFRISVFNIFLNALLDYWLIGPFGASGLVLATVGVNMVSLLMFLWLLDRRLQGLPLGQWAIPIVALTAFSGIAGVGSWGFYTTLVQFVPKVGFLAQLGLLSLAGIVGLGIFAVLTHFLKLPETELLLARLQQRWRRS
ncbi:murein biosynthesis integral membrane protein MurJ [Trichothermofontia sichuanensis B231]|uniref:murein biosynthesis integral membrane protein MurJ n=1 Tax=Trichothermofontia sichuanensis TaxID=3045816 RepID=UPI0022471472|nr:murein biosynthesis integral membrane protein MurJ [Trichothermofontia sichuanensis]UZQ53725.1 murein biosynthesis integral membrane protein MurJ [Trichothermofontia sichuanensis B231]